MKKPLEKYARLDSATGKGMNEGFCVNDGVAYFEEESDLIAYFRKDQTEKEALRSDEKLLTTMYAFGVYYYTEWDADDEETYYVEVNGEWLEVINAKVN
jgi:hypothetical protein